MTGKKNGTPLKDAVCGDVMDAPNLFQTGAFTPLTVHLVFLRTPVGTRSRLNPWQTYLDQVLTMSSLYEGDVNVCWRWRRPASGPCPILPLSRHL